MQEELAALLGVIQEQCKVASVSHQSKGHGFPAVWGAFPVFWNKILNVTNIKDNFSKLFSNFLSEIKLNLFYEKCAHTDRSLRFRNSVARVALWVAVHASVESPAISDVLSMIQCPRLRSFSVYISPRTHPHHHARRFAHSYLSLQLLIVYPGPSTSLGGEIQK